MNNILKPGLLILLFGLLFFSGCNSEKQVTAEMDELISDFIVKKYAASYADTEKQFEVHMVYGTSEKNGVLNVYMWSYYGGFNKSTGLEAQSGHSLPAVIQLSNKGENYSVEEYIEPEDGSSYMPSLKKMFPKKYLTYVIRDSGDIGGLQKKMDKKVKQWLEKQK